jgi:hypothetical protein
LMQDEQRHRINGELTNCSEEELAEIICQIWGWHRLLRRAVWYKFNDTPETSLNSARLHGPTTQKTAIFEEVNYRSRYKYV